MALDTLLELGRYRTLILDKPFSIHRAMTERRKGKDAAILGLEADDALQEIMLDKCTEPRQLDLETPYSASFRAELIASSRL